MSKDKGIYDGINRIIDEHFRTDKGKPFTPSQFSAESFIKAALSCIENNWENHSPRRKKGLNPSKKNWRFEKKIYLGKNNISLEKTLEKTIVSITNEDWVNQVPTAAGLYDSTKDKHRNVDLVHRLGSKKYEFIELKVKSDTPLKAAIEVVLYGVFYIFARLHYPSSYHQAHELLQADEIILCVLAPDKYYKPYNLKWLESQLCSGLQSVLVARDIKWDIRFVFNAFSPDFVWSANKSKDVDIKEYLLAELDEVAPAWTL